MGPRGPPGSPGASVSTTLSFSFQNVSKLKLGELAKGSDRMCTSA